MGLPWFFLTSSFIHSLIENRAFNYHPLSDDPNIEIHSSNVLFFDIGPHIYNF